MEQKSGNVVVGGHVVFLTGSVLYQGILRYVGRVQFAEGEWCGIELDTAVEDGHNGTVNDVEYFKCAENRGILVERQKVCLEGHQEEISTAGVQCIPSPVKTLSSPENEMRFPQLKCKSKIPSAVRSKAMKSLSSSAMAPLRAATVLVDTKCTEGRDEVRTFIDLRGSDGENTELRGRRIKGADRGDKSDDFILQQHKFSTVKSIRRIHSVGKSVHRRTNDPDPNGGADGPESTGPISSFLQDGENSRRNISDQSSIRPAVLPSHGEDLLFKGENSESHLRYSAQTGQFKKHRTTYSDDKDELNIQNVLNDGITSMDGSQVRRDIEGFHSDSEDLSSTGCCIKSIISLYSRPGKDSDDGRTSAKLPLCQSESVALSRNGHSSLCSQITDTVMTSAQDNSIGVKKSLPDVIGPSAFFSKIPRLQKLNDDAEDDEFGDAEYLGASQTSLASSFGILDDSDILGDTCLFPEGFAREPGHLQEQPEDQPESETCLTEVSPLHDLQSVRESADSEDVLSQSESEPFLTEVSPLHDLQSVRENADSQDVLSQSESEPFLTEVSPLHDLQSVRENADSQDVLSQSESEPFLTEISPLHDLQSVRENADSQDVLSKDCHDQLMTKEEIKIAAAADVVSDDGLIEMEGHLTECDPTEKPESFTSSSFNLDSAEHLQVEVDESLSDVFEDVVNVQQTDSEGCARNTCPVKCPETNEENVPACDLETEKMAAAEEKLSNDADGNEDDEHDEQADDDQRLSRIVVRVELEQQLVDRQKHRLSYDDPLDNVDQQNKLALNGKSVEKSSDTHESSEEATPDKASSSAVFDNSHKQEQANQEVETNPGGVGDKGGSGMGSKIKLIKTMQSRQLSTLDEKNEDSKRNFSDAKVEKEAGGKKRGEDKRRMSVGRTQLAADAEKPGMKEFSSVRRNLGRVMSYDASSQKPAISTSRIVPSLGDDSGGSSVNRFRRNRVASFDLGNTSSSSSSSSLKRSGIRRETLKATKTRESSKIEGGNTEWPQNDKTLSATTATTNNRPSLLSRLNSSFTAGKTYAVAKNNKTPSDSNLFGSGTVALSGSILPRRTSTPMPHVEDPAPDSSSTSLESSRTNLLRKQQLSSSSAKKKEFEKQDSVINSKSKTTNAAKSGQLRPRIGKRNEKNLDGKINSKQQQEWHLQKHHHPDLVPNAAAQDREMVEVLQLEQLCESRLQQLNCLNSEVQCKTKWFQALVIVVQHLSQRLDSDNQNDLRCRLNECQEQLDSMRTKIYELTKQRDALIDEIQLLKEEEEKQRETLKYEHQVQLNDFKEALQLQHEENLSRALDDYNEKIAALEVNQQQQISELKEFHEQVLTKNHEDHQSSQTAQKSEHDSILQELKKQHARQLDDITLRFEHIKFSLSEKVEYLRSECEEMRRREVTFMESCQAEMEQKLQLALLPYRHLPEEIESLKAVLELRNLELHDLRQQNLQLQRQAQELPAAHETIKKFQQKVENLEAVIKIRTDYERQLSEKHQQLLRRYDRESKANKRLSMDKEELIWRLSSSQAAEQSEASISSSSSFDAFQRSLGHSLTAASGRAGGKSPGSDISDGVDLAKSVSETASSSFLSASPVASRMHRSGTYDLLCDALGDENTKSSRLSPSK